MMRRGIALIIAAHSIVGVGAASAQTIWDDPAFALYQKGVEALNKKDFETADRLAGEAIQQYGTHVLAYYLRAQAAIAQSKWEAAAAALKKVNELYPTSFAGQRDLGLVYQQMGRIDDATRAYKAALALRPDQEDLSVRLAFMLVKENQDDRAEPILQQLADKDSKIPEVWLALGRIAYERGEYATTEKAFTRALTLRDDGRTWFNLGVIRFKQNNTKGALEAFERAAKHAETKEQAAREIDKLRTAAKGDAGPAREMQKPGSTSVQPTSPPRY